MVCVKMRDQCLHWEYIHRLLCRNVCNKLLHIREPTEAYVAKSIDSQVGATGPLKAQYQCLQNLMSDKTKTKHSCGHQAMKGPSYLVKK